MHSASFRIWALGPSPETAKVVSRDVWLPPWQGPLKLDLASGDRYGAGICLPLFQSQLKISTLWVWLPCPHLPRKDLLAEQLGAACCTSERAQGSQLLSWTCAL